MNRTPCRCATSKMSRSSSGVCIRMPPAPCTSGSTMTAATSPAMLAAGRRRAGRRDTGTCQRAEQQRLEAAEEQRVAADGHRPERVAVVAVLEADEQRAAAARRGGTRTGTPSSARPRPRCCRCRSRRRARRRHGADAEQQLGQLDRRRVRDARRRGRGRSVPRRLAQRPHRAAGGGGRAGSSTTTRCRRSRAGRRRGAGTRPRRRRPAAASSGSRERRVRVPDEPRGRAASRSAARRVAAPDAAQPRESRRAVRGAGVGRVRSLPASTPSGGRSANTGSAAPCRAICSAANASGGPSSTTAAGRTPVPLPAPATALQRPADRADRGRRRPGRTGRPSAADQVDLQLVVGQRRERAAERLDQQRLRRVGHAPRRSRRRRASAGLRGGRPAAARPAPRTRAAAGRRSRAGTSRRTVASRSRRSRPASSRRTRRANAASHRSGERRLARVGVGAEDDEVVHAAQRLRDGGRRAARSDGRRRGRRGSRCAAAHVPGGTVGGRIARTSKPLLLQVGRGPHGRRVVAERRPARCSRARRRRCRARASAARNAAAFVVQPRAARVVAPAPRGIARSHHAPTAGGSAVVKIRCRQRLTSTSLSSVEPQTYAPGTPSALPPVWTVASTRSRSPAASTQPGPGRAEAAGRVGFVDDHVRAVPLRERRRVRAAGRGRRPC